MLLRVVKPSFRHNRYRVFLGSANSPVISPFEHKWDFVCRCLARDILPQLIHMELWVSIEAISDALPPIQIQNLLYSIPRRIEALIPMPDECKKCWFLTCNSVSLISKFNHLFFPIQVIYEKNFIQMWWFQNDVAFFVNMRIYVFEKKILNRSLWSF